MLVSSKILGGSRTSVTLKTTLRFNSSSTSALAYKALHHRKKQPRLPTLDTPNWSAQGAVSSILYETPLPSKSPKKQHILNCLVQNEPGVLSLVSGILAARGFNIDSLVVCNTDVKDLSRMTIILKGQAMVIEQAIKQIEDLVPVFAVLDYSNAEIIKRELLLTRVSLLGPEYFQDFIKQHEISIEAEETLSELDNKYHPKNLTPSEMLRIKNSYLTALQTLTKQFGGKIVDISNKNCIIELTGKPERITNFLKLIKPFGILEVARSGMMALPRTPLSEGEMEEEDTAVDIGVDLSDLPPG
ncbi:acetolactate synthase regulatory subunit [Saccharomycopsis crataegensis]|uniref:Acetolactate synthase regulatory subunit n=1 Tax=Saccharomycopsis crataegensis TaxID=43959 RepID=A0AAV5QLK4_9ASCO|nr:acetolactate synthase regulatory subunit [Saccharomycopsis crataegensis]